MKKVSLLALALFVSMSASAFAGNLEKGQAASCENANAITIEVAKIDHKPDATGYTSNDRGSANVVVWKSSNFTTVPITLGPNDSNQTNHYHNETGVPLMGENGRAKVVLTKQEAFSRGDSIGDISGKVTVTNSGTNPVTVSCN
jgi:hypothetical protein